jgi:hypothetical protein
MKYKKNSSPLKEKDEYLHQPNKDLKWRESYYFNWADLKNHLSGFSTIGIVPNEKRREFVFLLFLEDRKESKLIKYEDNIDTMLKEKRLSYKLIKPFKIWEIHYTSRKLSLNLTFETRFPTYYFGQGSSASWHQHFEASGTIKGSLVFNDGKETLIDGYGQRDKSWGFRDWHQFNKWYAGHFQFERWSCTFRKDYYRDNINLSGHISKNDGNIPLSQLEIETVNDVDKLQSPIRAAYKITANNGQKFIIQAERIKKDSYIRFVRDFPGGFTELFEQMVFMKNENTGEIGSGMMEHLRTKMYD